MNTLIFWTMIVILYQTVFTIVLSWLTLSCKFTPRETELREITLIKLLYLYDPDACGRVFFYNYTSIHPVHLTAIAWPIKNTVATSFRQKIQVWLSLHVIWALLGGAYMFQGQRPCGVYATLLPFTLVGIAVLIMDVSYTAIFLMDVNKTSNEAGILNYINTNIGDLRAVQTIHPSSPLLRFNVNYNTSEVDTSWIALLMAYISCRAVVQWVINFWLIKDNYYAGVEYHRRIRKMSATIRNQAELDDLD